MLFSVGNLYIVSYNILSGDGIDNIDAISVRQTDGNNLKLNIFQLNSCIYVVWSSEDFSYYKNISVHTEVTQLSIYDRFLAASFNDGSVWLYDLAEASASGERETPKQEQGTLDFTSFGTFIFLHFSVVCRIQS